MIASIHQALLASPHNQFLAMLPHIRRQASFAFRNTRREAREELVQEAVASAFRAFSAAGERLANVGDDALAAGRRASAREAYWQATNYLFSSTYFIDEMGQSETSAHLVYFLHDAKRLNCFLLYYESLDKDIPATLLAGMWCV